MIACEAHVCRHTHPADLVGRRADGPVGAEGARRSDESIDRCVYFEGARLGSVHHGGGASGGSYVDLCANR